MWNDLDFDAIKFIGVRLPFLEDFIEEYKFINSHVLLKLSNIKETHLFMVMLIEHVNKEKHAQTENKLTSKLTGCQWDNVKGQSIIEVLQKEKETLMTKLQEAKIKDEEFVTSQQKLQVSLDIAPISQKNLEEEVYVLKEDLMQTSNIYFEREKEQVTFFHPGLDLISMDIFKVVSEGQLMDDEDNPFYEQSITSLIKDTQAKPNANKVVEEVNLKATRQEDAFEEMHVTDEGQ